MLAVVFSLRVLHDGMILPFCSSLCKIFKLLVVAVLAFATALPLDNDSIQSSLRLFQGGYDDQLIIMPDTIFYFYLIASFL